MPDASYWARTPLEERERLSVEEFGQRYGAAPAELEAVAAFARSHGMRVLQTNAARRTVEATGTVAQMNAAFAIGLQR
jgi:kumamolisin